MGVKGKPFHKGRPFEKGNKANPSGRPPVPKEFREFQKMTYQDFIDKLQQFGNIPKSELKAIIADENTTVFENVFGRVLFEAMNGNMKAIDILFTRLWGKPREMDPELNPDQLGPKVQIILPDNLRDRIIEVETKAE